MIGFRGWEADPRQGDRLSSYLQKWPAFVVGYGGPSLLFLLKRQQALWLAVLTRLQLSSGAGAAYVFGCLPELLRPTGPLAALLIFCSGLTVGVLCLVVVGVSVGLERLTCS